MESLYTKYRPQTFADVVGQSHVVTTLEHAVIEGRTSHAYLFCGPRGTGKTTMARLLAKALMCEQGEGHLPDGTCDQCRMIAAGEHPDVYELDAASRTGVDNVRDEIISRVSFAPVQAPYKMYIIDEVHMLTTAAFNALLKTLEEPPAHVVFVLCTTDPQKIPETILSRVQRFDFHAIGNADIQGRLAYICEREGFTYDPEALELIVRHARGGMRDAISELEQLSVSGGGSITVEVARDVLGEVSASTLERMSLAMANREVATLFAQVESLVEVGRDLLQFTRALAARLRDVYVVAALGASSNTVAASDDELPAISREAKAFGSVDRVARALALLSDASTEMRVAPNQRLVLEVALTKIARPQTELTLEALADRVATLERQVVALSVPEARRTAEAPRASGGEAARNRKEASMRQVDAAEAPAREPQERSSTAAQQVMAHGEARENARAAYEQQPGEAREHAQVAHEQQPGEAREHDPVAYGQQPDSQRTGGPSQQFAAAARQPIQQGAEYGEAPVATNRAQTEQPAPAYQMADTPAYAQTPAGQNAASPQMQNAASPQMQSAAYAGAAPQRGVTGQGAAQEAAQGTRGYNQDVPVEGAPGSSGRQMEPERFTATAQQMPYAAPGTSTRASAPQQTAPSGQARAPQPSTTPQETVQEPAATAVQSAAISDMGELQRRWKQVVDGLLATHPQHGSLLMNSTIVADDGSMLTVSFPKGSMFACRMLDRADVRANVDPMIASVFGPRKTRFAEGATAPAPRATAAPQSAAASAPVSAPRSAGTPASRAGEATMPGAAAQSMRSPQNAQASSQAAQGERRAQQPAAAQQMQQPEATQWPAATQQAQQPEDPQHPAATQQAPTQQAVAQSAPVSHGSTASSGVQGASQSAPATTMNAQATAVQQGPQYLAPWEEAPTSAPAEESQHQPANAQAGSAQAQFGHTSQPVPAQSQASSARAQFDQTSPSVPAQANLKPTPSAQVVQTQPNAQQAPWESTPLGDDMVPYDDFDTSPYEEEYAFGYAPESASQARPAAGAGPQPLTGWQTPAAQTRSWEAPSPAAGSQQTYAPNAQAHPQMDTGAFSPAPQMPAQEPAMQSEAVATPASATSAPELTSMSTSSQLAGAPASAPSSEASAPSTNAPASDSITASAPAAGAPQEPAAASAKPKRTRRPAAAIPADIIAMMAEVFGEGITYTSLEPEDDETEAEEEPLDEGGAESEFVEEPVDDADYDEEE